MEKKYPQLQLKLETCLGAAVDLIEPVIFYIYHMTPASSIDKKIYVYKATNYFLNSLSNSNLAQKNLNS
jgi:hypothetical protein